jgi:hypothetical protein
LFCFVLCFTAVKWCTTGAKDIKEKPAVMNRQESGELPYQCGHGRNVTRTSVAITSLPDLEPYLSDICIAVSEIKYAQETVGRRTRLPHYEFSSVTL